MACKKLLAKTLSNYVFKAGDIVRRRPSTYNYGPPDETRFIVTEPTVANHLKNAYKVVGINTISLENGMSYTLPAEQWVLVNRDEVFK